MQTALVILIVAAAAVYVGRRFYNGLKQQNNCNCGCTSCGIDDSCDELQSEHSRKNTTDRNTLR
jgi:hypothetical protein